MRLSGRMTSMLENEFTLQIPNEHPCFAGHFPGNPILPGAVLLRFVQKELQLFYPTHRITRINSAKFLEAVKPGDTLDVMSRHNPQDARITLEIKRSGAVVGRAKCSFEGEVAAP